METGSKVDVRCCRGSSSTHYSTRATLPLQVGRKHTLQSTLSNGISATLSLYSKLYVIIVFIFLFFKLPLDLGCDLMIQANNPL